MRQLIVSFNGNRHVRATLVDARGQQLAASELFASQPQPAPGLVP